MPKASYSRNCERTGGQARLRTHSAVVAVAGVCLTLLIARPVAGLASPGKQSPLIRTGEVVTPSGSRFEAQAMSQGAATSAAVMTSLPASVGGVHYVYADDGGCTGPRTGDGIDVFVAAGTRLTFIQHVTAGCAGYFNYLGTTDAHKIGIAKADSTHGNCLLYAAGSEVLQRGFPSSSGMTVGGYERVYSFTIDGTGRLSASPASSLTLADSAFSEVVVSPTGNIAYFAGSGGAVVNSASVGAGCALRWLSTSTVGANHSWAFVNPGLLVDTDGCSLLFYRPAAGGLLTQIASHAVSTPCTTTHPMGSGVLHTTTSAGYVTNIYTGQAWNTPPPPQAFGFQSTVNGAVTSLNGSPAATSDLQANSGGTVLVDPTNRLLLQADQGDWFLSTRDCLNGLCYPNNAVYFGRVGWYTLAAGTPGSPGSITYGGDTAVLNDGPDALAAAGSVLFVGTWMNGDLQACSVGSKGVSACRQVATLTNGTKTYAGSSLAVF